MEIRSARPDDLGPIRALLGAADLPTEDVGEHLANFLVAQADSDLAGVCGMEIYGPVALVRSVAVAPAFRGQGLASRLCDTLEARAGARGVGAFYLLTTTADGFFARRGFRPVPRTEAPPEIQRSKEFAALCPDSAIFMARRLTTREPEAGRGRPGHGRAALALVLAAWTLACGDDGSPTAPGPGGQIQGSGNRVTQNRAVADFRSVVLSNAGTVNLSQGATQAVSVTVDDNIQPGPAPPFASRYVRGFVARKVTDRTLPARSAALVPLASASARTSSGTAPASFVTASVSTRMSTSSSPACLTSAKYSSRWSAPETHPT